MLLLSHLAPLCSLTYWRHGGVNCYAGAGATEIDHNPAGKMTAASCQQLCDNTTDCAGVVFRRLELQWTRHADTNCYEGYGANDVRLNSAAILREDNLYRKKQESEAAVLRAFERDLRDSAEFDAWQEKMKQQDEDERQKYIEQRRMET